MAPQAANASADDRSTGVPTAWWVYTNATASFVSTNNARLIDLEPYSIGFGVIRYAVVMVSNTGAAARAWSYLSGVSASQITTHINNSRHRMIDLDTYFVGANEFYSAVFVANTGADAKAWQTISAPWYNAGARAAAMVPACPMHRAAAGSGSSSARAPGSSAFQSGCSG